jgi:hypothetical protein
MPGDARDVLKNATLTGSVPFGLAHIALRVAT